MTRRSGTVAVALAGVAALVVLAVLVAPLLRPEPALPGVVRDPAPDVHGLAFTDVWQRDEPVTVDLVPAEGEITLAYFGYLSCPDVCPMTMADLRRARQLVGDETAARTTVAFVTVDPGRDDAERLNAYLSLFFDDRVLALTAPDTAALDAAAEQLGVRYELEDPDEAGAYEVLHSAIIYVIDDRGAVVRELPFGVPAEDVARVIEATLRERS